jgi:hypothetical protein
MISGAAGAVASSRLRTAASLTPSTTSRWRPISNWTLRWERQSNCPAGAHCLSPAGDGGLIGAAAGRDSDREVGVSIR